MKKILETIKETWNGFVAWYREYPIDAVAFVATMILIGSMIFCTRQWCELIVAIVEKIWAL